MDRQMYVVLGVVVVVQLALQVTAVVQLVRTDAARITIGGRKWVWGLIIVGGEILGPLLWFALGRTPAVGPDVTGVADEAGRESVVDELYGKRAD